jgi:hypothetical protein
MLPNDWLLLVLRIVLRVVSFEVLGDELVGSIGL